MRWSKKRGLKRKRRTKEGEKKIAVRVSDYESIITAEKVSNLVSWIWLDVFNNLVLTEEEFLNLKKLNFVTKSK